ncbi:acyl-CoA carboxylase subunit beta [Alkalihalobacillus trypoxylicola]|uniref:Methylmalonyl-CoA carboxyltransferase n=1 Tax=Alkalihalobacillus trypoxylicola TaxID=519424 RepID=A0A162EDV7_9BACI|nr:acyl-CoA carboxylase subunit beta [Alkalihalobacillus trypoxylicola]KYG32350.1 methylmalonyl-CoA carboxyltransferase [Alkalihalobacillus trypoxylicola]
MKKQINQLETLKIRLKRGGGKEKIKQQYLKGKRTARERINILLDHKSFTELNTFMTKNTNVRSVENLEGDGVITGYGKIKEKLVFVYAQDFTVHGGSLGEIQAKKIVKIMDMAFENKAPIIGLIDSGGANIQEGVKALDGYGQILYRNCIYSGIIPQISVILGPCAGGAVYSPALCDFVFMVKNISKMFITGPRVIEEVTGEYIDEEKLGGTNIHSKESGVAHFVEETEEEILKRVREVVSYIPDANKGNDTFAKEEIQAPVTGNLLEIVPTERKKTYNMHHVIEHIVDKGSILEVQKEYARNMIVSFAKVGGQVVGIVANNPKVKAGAIDIDASDKCARFVRFCDAFKIPLIVLEDVGGFLPGIHEEQKGLIRHGAKVIFAFSEATVPKITVIIRKAYGGAFVALNSKALGADFVFAWPSAEIAVMGAEGAIQILHTKELAENKEGNFKQKKIEEYYEKYANPYLAASFGMIDEMISPTDTRKYLISSLQTLKNKSKHLPINRHNNLPL